MVKKDKIKILEKSLSKRDRERSFSEKFHEQFIKSLRYIKEIKNYIIFSFLLFLVVGLFGYFFPIYFSEEILELIENLIAKTEGLSSLELIAFIIDNNIRSSFIGVLFGIFLGIVPLGVILVNGYVLGFVSHKTVGLEGILILWRLFPHGIFEIPAFIISVALGLKIGMFFFSTKDKQKGFLAFLLSLICFFFLIGIFSLVVSFFAPSQDMEVLGDYFDDIMSNPIIGGFFLIYVLLSFIFSLFFGRLVFSKNDRGLVFNNLFYSLLDSLRVFVFVVIPLLVIAGIIEGILIWFVG